MTSRTERSMTKSTHELERGLVQELQNLIALEYDAIEAYKSALARLDNHQYRDKLREFKGDHEGHVKSLSTFLKKNNEDFPTGPDAGSYLTKGKVILANLIGDMTILKAMKSNEQETNGAYEDIVQRRHLPDEIKNILSQGLADERRHYAWFEATLKKAA